METDTGNGRLAIYLGIFGVMALSNAIVPVLPAFAGGPALQSSIYSAYFLGAFLTVLPAGLLSDRVGRVPVIRAGLAVTVASGLLILVLSDPLLVLAARVAEGVGAGLFVASAMSWMNSREDHERISGDFMASLNLGLVVGLLGSGLIDDALASERAGILAFTLLSVLPAVLVFLIRRDKPGKQVGEGKPRRSRGVIWLYLSAVILVGSTGVVTALYPSYTGRGPASLGIILATMNLATILAVILASRLHLPPVRTIQVAGLVLAGAVLSIPFTPAGFALVGILLGFIMIAQLAFLADSGLPQGEAMGFYNAASYAGMTLLPFVSGVIAEQWGFLPAFALVAFFVVIIAAAVGWPDSREAGAGKVSEP
ncbi:MAG TPA: MFS transporter [Methanomicrobiales archaeon]|nr:MFS transporter [Methanomicrobiales archaeon]